MLTYDEIRRDPEIRCYIQKADASVASLGYTEHSFAHVGVSAERCRYILEAMGYDERTVELAQIAAWLHDIGNLVNRVGHSQSGALMAFYLLRERGMDPVEIAEIVAAIGNHDEGTGTPVSPIAAALILADKSDVRRNRVRPDAKEYDIHDRVNYSVRESRLEIDAERTKIMLELTVDTQYGSVMDYFEIFMQRMLMCRRAAESLGLQFKLIINGQTLL